jgi:predicted nucleic acid-binding protein
LIILDTNVLSRHGSLTGPTVALVRAIAEKTGHTLALPAIVVEEAVAELARELSRQWDKTKTAAEALAQFFPGYRIDQPDLAQRVQQWRTDLTQSFTILDPPSDAANEALRREAHRIAPTRAGAERGSGARDALIWLTVLEAYRREPADGATYFVTNNSRDFGSGRLMPSLQREVNGVGTTASFHYLSSMTELLDELATPAGEGPGPTELLASAEVLAAVQAALAAIDVISDDYWRQRSAPIAITTTVRMTNFTDSTTAIQSKPAITSASLYKAEATKAYEVGGQRFAAVWTIWDGVTATFSTSTGTAAASY